ncbi:hypothetical protein, conserved [Leishmania tarentolae]|uniref:Uncharacterized protein n=1 Tax=Leishmania tarentolae TaxID=5689 RepID=A0A640KL92_LEITA|nr:hypothetical protein, conserved [Leishmania tarentolae]
MNASSMSKRRGKPPTEVVVSTETVKKAQAARLLGRINEHLHASRAFSAWEATIRQRRLQMHLKRCSMMLKHNSLRQEYARCFMRWLAFTQARASENARSAIRLRQDVPLRSKADFLALARRYFAKWRRHVRERGQRKVTNVKLLEELNKERLRSRMVIKWWRFHDMQAKKRCVTEIAAVENENLKLKQELQKAVHEAKDLRDQLRVTLQQQSVLQSDLEVSRGAEVAAAQQRQREVDELREAMQQAVKLLEGSSSSRFRSLQKWSTVSASPCTPSGVITPPTQQSKSSEILLKSVRQSKDAAEALLSAVEDTLVSFSSLARMSTPPASLKECATHLRGRLSEETKEVSLKAQRDELASAAQTTRATLAAVKAFAGPSLMASVVRKPTPPSIRAPTTPPDITLIDFQKLPQLLVEDAKAVAAAMQAMHQEDKRSADEVANLQGAALQALSTFGGGDAKNTNLVAKPQESMEHRAKRSANIADSLRTLCENMDAVLVLTSLCSGKGASGKVSVALEGLWHRTQDLEAAHADDLQRLELYTAVVHTSAGILRPPPPPPSSTMSPRTAALLARRQHRAQPGDSVATPEQVEAARHSAEQLAIKGDRKPTELIELCLKAQQRGAAEQSSVPMNEFDRLAKSAQEIINVTIGRSRREERGVRFSATHRSRPDRFSVASEIADSVAGKAEVSPSGTTQPLTAEALERALTAAAAVAVETLRGCDGVVDDSLVDAIVRAREQVRQLQEQLTTLTMSERHNSDAKKSLQAELKEANARNIAIERTLKKYANDLDQGRDSVEQDLERQLRALQREAAQSAQDRRKLEDERKGLEEDNKKKEEALQAQMEAREKERLEYAEAKRSLCEEVENLRRQLAAAESKNLLGSETSDVPRRHLNDAQRKGVDYDAIIADLEAQLCSANDAVETAALARRELVNQLSASEEANRKSNAISVFLRDALWDCTARLRHLTHNVRGAATLQPSLRRTLTLQQASDRPPPMLACDSDPSEYVEYLLRLSGNDAMGKLLVQQHLREKVAVQKLQEFGVDGGVPDAPRADASTWEVVTKLHDRLVLLYHSIAHVDERTVEQRARVDEPAVVKDHQATDVLEALVELKPWSSVAAAAAHTEHLLESSTSEKSSGSSPNCCALRTSCSEVAQALEEMEKVAAFTRPLMGRRSSRSPPRRSSADGQLDMSSTDAAGTNRLLSLVADVQGMADCLQHLSESVMQGIAALGGTSDEGEMHASNNSLHRESESSPMTAAATESNAVTRHTQAGHQTGCVNARKLTTRLEAICKETGTSVQELKQLLGVGEGDRGASTERSKARGKAWKLSDALPLIRAKMQELQEVKQQSEQILVGLNCAFSDDDSPSFTSSTQHSLRRKQKPLPALQCAPESGLRLMQQEIKGRKNMLQHHGEFASVLQCAKATVQECIRDVQKLSFTISSAVQVLEGRPVEGNEAAKPPKYGEALMALLTAQIVDLKQVLPETEEALAGYRSDLVSVTVSTRLHLLCGVVRSLRLERDSLKEELARRSLQRDMLLNDFIGEAKTLRAMLTVREEEQVRLASKMANASEEADSQKRNVNNLTAKLASSERERSILCSALVYTLCSFPGTPYRGTPLAGVQRSLLATLEEQGESLMVYVEATLRRAHAHQQHLQVILHDSLDELRCALAALRAQVTISWNLYGQHMANEAVQQLMEATEVLTLENNMLRPRAIEREQLKLEKALLEAALANAKDDHADVLARLEHAEDENTKLRREVRDAEIVQVLTNGDDNEGDDSRKQSSGKDLSTLLLDLERRMIGGATELTMNVVESMSGTPMPLALGSVAKETLRIYSGVRDSLRKMVAVYEASHGKDEYHVRIMAEEQLLELRQLSESADHLFSRLPVLCGVLYQCGERDRKNGTETPTERESPPRLVYEASPHVVRLMERGSKTKARVYTS